MEKKTNVVPGPGAYDAKFKEKLIGSFKSTSGKGQYIDHYRAIGMDTPGFIYNTNVAIIRPKIPIVKMSPES